MNDFEQWLESQDEEESAMFSSQWRIGWNAAIALMQGDAVGVVTLADDVSQPDTSGKHKGKYQNMVYSYAPLQVGAPIFTYPPDAAAEIARLTKKLEEARKDAERISDLLIEAKAEIQECLDDHCNMMETKPHRPAIWQQLLGSIDAAISKIGGAE